MTVWGKCVYADEWEDQVFTEARCNNLIRISNKIADGVFDEHVGNFFQEKDLTEDALKEEAKTDKWSGVCSCAGELLKAEWGDKSERARVLPLWHYCPDFGTTVVK